MSQVGGDGIGISLTAIQNHFVDTSTVSNTGKQAQRSNKNQNLLFGDIANSQIENLLV